MNPVPGLEIGVFADGDRLAGDLFRRRFRLEPPDFPIHVLCMARLHDEPAPIALCYIHFSEVGGMLLGGGACIDNRALRRCPESMREAIRASGGLYLMTLRWAVEHFRADYDAVFGYCGDVLAERVDLAAGFVRTEHRHLLVHWCRKLDEARRAELIAAAHAASPF